MTIEALLERIAVATEATHELLRVYGVPAASPSPETVTPPVESRKRGRPAKVETPAAAPADAGIDFGDAPSDTSFLDEDTTEAPAVVVYTREDVRSALVALQKKHGNPELARNVLKTAGGCDTLKSLDESKFAAVVEAAGRA